MSSGRAFTVDENLKGLLRKLRMLGIDCLGPERIPDEAVIRLSESQNRVVLTRDRDLPRIRSSVPVYLVRSADPEEQLLEVIREFGLWPVADPLARCLRCNDPLEEIEREEARASVPSESFEAFRNFYRCPACRKIFWEGSHFERMQDWLEGIRRKIEDRDV